MAVIQSACSYHDCSLYMNYKLKKKQANVKYFEICKCINIMMD